MPGLRFVAPLLFALVIFAGCPAFADSPSPQSYVLQWLHRYGVTKGDSFYTRCNNQWAQHRGKGPNIIIQSDWIDGNSDVDKMNGKTPQRHLWFLYDYTYVRTYTNGAWGQWSNDYATGYGIGGPPGNAQLNIDLKTGQLLPMNASIYCPQHVPLGPIPS